MLVHKFVECKWCGRKVSAVSGVAGKEYKVECNTCHDVYFLCPNAKLDDKQGVPT